jgi:hypothetical protein
MKDIRIQNTMSNAGALTKEHELQLSRSGIYNNVVSYSKSVHEVFLGNLKSDFWEFQEQFVNEPKVMSIKCNQKRFYTGSKKRKMKKVITTLESSSMFYSLHTLKRYRERSWSNEEINITDFHSIDDKWINKLSDNGLGYLVSNDKNEWSCRQDILVPYGDGAFLGHIGRMNYSSSNRVDTFTITYRKRNQTYSMSDPNRQFSLPTFTTRTYIGRKDFTWFQEQIFNQYHSNDWDDAIDTMKNNRMKEDHWDFNIRM